MPIHKTLPFAFYVVMRIQDITYRRTSVWKSERNMVAAVSISFYCVGSLVFSSAVKNNGLHKDHVCL